jgi:hypothetical protein
MTTGVDIARLQRGLVLCASCSLRARARFLMKKSEEEDFLIVFSQQKLRRKKATKKQQARDAKSCVGLFFLRMEITHQTQHTQNRLTTALNKYKHKRNFLLREARKKLTPSLPDDRGAVRPIVCHNKGPFFSCFVSFLVLGNERKKRDSKERERKEERDSC